jgi:O-6-methylguanine DNA methyltransferase
MRTFTKRADRYPGLGPVTEINYLCELGVGRLVVIGDLPLELYLPVPFTAEPESREADATRGVALQSGCGPVNRWSYMVERYFAAESIAFALDVGAFAEVHGFTDFERDVYGALAEVPYGATVSYSELAVLAGHPNAYRAVGSTMARNPLPVILPCHRVIRSDGCLGYYGDDPAWKKRLLALEGVAVCGDRLAKEGVA